MGEVTRADGTVAQVDGLTDEDRTYIRANFVTLDEACRNRSEQPGDVRALMRDRKLPLPAYVLDDGTELVAADYFALVDDAGQVQSLHAHFVDRYRRAVASHGDGVADVAVEEEWQGYLSGAYFVCLRCVTPEAVFRKGWLMTQIERLLADSRPDDPQWRARLTTFVDELDALEREFAPYDRRRWGPVSRDRLITGVREQYGLDPRTAA